MARKHQSGAAEALDEIQSGADRLAEWIRENGLLVAGSVAALLVATSGISLWSGSRTEQEEEAAAALAAARLEYLGAMGASPNALDVPELANPTAAAAIQADFDAALSKVAADFKGTTAEALARFESARLDQQAGDLDAALAGFESLAADASVHPGLRGLAIQGAAQVLEDRERWSEAADRHERAAALTGYPLRQWALADAARCRTAARETERALALYERLDAEAPDLRLPAAQRAQVRELRATVAR